MLAQGFLERAGGYLRLPGHRAVVSQADRALWARVEPILLAFDLRPPTVVQIAEELGTDRSKLERGLQSLAHHGLLVQVTPSRYFLPRSLQVLANRFRSLSQAAPDGLVGIRAFCDDTGIGRNLSIDVLEYFDAAGLTNRVGDMRALLASDGDLGVRFDGEVSCL